MISAIAGDMIGVPFEFNNIKEQEYTGPLFTRKSTYSDDSVLAVATADSLLSKTSYSDNYLKYASAYPDRGYGGMFLKMVRSGRLTPYNSYGNGSAMRAGPTGWVHSTMEKTLEEAKRSADASHNHPEGIKGAQAVAAAIFTVRKGGDRGDVMRAVQKLGYDLSYKMSELRRRTFHVDCQGTIPVCMAIFNETESFEDAMRKSIAMGGDVDTNCCIIGSICDAFYGLPSPEIIKEVYSRIPNQMAKVVTAFVEAYIDERLTLPETVTPDPLNRFGLDVEKMKRLFL